MVRIDQTYSIVEENKWYVQNFGLRPYCKTLFQ